MPLHMRMERTGGWEVSLESWYTSEWRLIAVSGSRLLDSEDAELGQDGDSVYDASGETCGLGRGDQRELEPSGGFFTDVFGPLGRAA